MAGPDPATWTAELVLRAMRAAISSQPHLFGFVLHRARDVLGEDSAEFVALIARCAPRPGASVREMVRIEKHALRHSRSGAERVAAALTDDGIAVPAGIGK